MHEKVQENAEEIGQIFNQVSEIYNGQKICNDSTRIIMKYADNKYELSDCHIQ